MNPQNNIGKVVSWSIELETSNSGRKTVTQVPQFVAAVIDDFIRLRRVSTLTYHERQRYSPIRL